jgi:hypothetical protein
MAKKSTPHANIHQEAELSQAAAAAIGARRGASTSEAKKLAVQENGAKGGRPPHTLFHKVTRNPSERAW